MIDGSHVVDPEKVRLCTVAMDVDLAILLRRNKCSNCNSGMRYANGLRWVTMIGRAADKSSRVCSCFVLVEAYEAKVACYWD